MVRNKQMSFPMARSNDQHCNARGCRQCPQINDQSSVTINGNTLHIPKHLNCKSKNVIYMWTCKLCGESKTYFGRTTQECHNRTSGHRGCFNNDKWEKSALSMHAKEVHQTQVKKVSPQRLRREEFKYIDKYRTNSLGLNRYKV